jgi:hypothetical protein
MHSAKKIKNPNINIFRYGPRVFEISHISLTLFGIFDLTCQTVATASVIGRLVF